MMRKYGDSWFERRRGTRRWRKWQWRYHHDWRMGNAGVPYSPPVKGTVQKFCDVFSSRQVSR